MAATPPKLERRSMAEQVRDDLRARMTSGSLTAGERLPSEPECCTIYGVSRATVREAYRLLEQEGLVDVRRGSGRFVRAAAHVMVQGTINIVRSTTAFLESLGYEPRVEVLDVIEREPTALEAESFGSGVQRVIEVQRVYLHEDELLDVATNVFDVRALPIPADEIDWSSSMAALWSQHGRELAEAVTDITAVVLPESIRDKGYVIPAAAAWLQSDGPQYDQRGTPMWWSRELMRGDIRPLRVVNRRDPAAGPGV